jgi:beta-galactosidase
MSLKILQFAFLLIGISFFTKGQNRQIIPLDGNWSFAIDSTNQGMKENWQNGIPPPFSHEVRVPHTWNIEPGTEEYAGTAWYEKNVDLKEEWKNKNIRLKFNAVYHDATVYINGKKAGENMNSGFTPFTIDITEFVNFKGINSIVVKVSNEYSGTMFPYMRSFDWANDGGIIRPVYIEISGNPSFRYVHVTPDFNLQDSTGVATVSIKLWESNIKNAAFNFVFKEKKSGKVVQTFSSEMKSLNGIFSKSFTLGKIKPWHFDFPNLYVLETSIISREGISDNEVSTFGFKRLEIREDSLFLNGERIRLPGLEYMPGSNPEYGAAEPFTYMDSVVRAMKDLNICITRFHWQQDDNMLRLMDEYGILVQEEMPWWQNPGDLTPELLNTARKQLADNIEAHYNHPCIFSWGLSNEVSGNTDKSIFVKLRDFVKDLDSSRFVTVVSNEIWIRQEEDESLICDIPTWNEYMGTWHGKSRNEIPEKFDIIKHAIGNRPLLITEHGLCEPVFTGGDARRIDEMLFHTSEWAKQPYVIGYIYFCLNDYRTQMGEEGIGKFKIRRHGITDMVLSPKPSYFVLKQISSPVYITKVERLNNSDAKIEIKVRNDIPDYTLRSYIIQFRTIDDRIIEVSLPDLNPGDIYSTELRQINSRFAFKILRPNGFCVIQY